MNGCPEKAREYEMLKASLAARFPSDRKSYTEGKAAFVEKALKEASMGAHMVK
jgi:GrpB-like predicted nucleotidyltransferase (UPF0157 family)